LSERIEEKTNVLGLKVYLLKILRYWYLFLVAGFVSFFLAKVYLPYQLKRYEVSAKVLIRDENQKSYMSSVVDELALASGFKNMYNEMEVLNSHKLIVRSLKQLPFYVSYFSEGRVKRNHLFRESPFVVEIDSSHSQIAGVRFNIVPVSNTTFEIQAAGSGTEFYYYKDSLGANASIDLSGEYKFGDTLIAESY
jgi:hypothetical protein